MNLVFLKQIVNLVLLSILMIVCNSCSYDRGNKPRVFHYNQPNPVTSIDPAFAKTQNNIWIVDHLYNQLVDLNDSMQVVPELATNWNILDSGRVYEFKIRDDVYFHKDKCFGGDSTRKLTSADVVFSFSRLLDPKLSAPGSWIFADKVDSKHPFESIGDTLFRIYLKAPFSPLLTMLTMQYCSVLPKEAIAYYGDLFREHEVGTGPFILKKWIDRQGIFLIKNNHYYKSGIPELEGIRVSFIEDRNTAYLEFLKHGIDFFSGVQSSFGYQILTKEGRLREEFIDKIKFYRSDYLNTEYFGINLNALDKNHALNNKLIRQALNYAVDRNSMLKTFRLGIGTEANSGFIPKGLPGFDPKLVKGYYYDPQKAKALLAEAKYDLMPLNQKEMIIYTNKDYADLVTYVVRQWQEIGVLAKIELLETATLREKMRNGSLSFFRASWVADYPDEESFMTVFYSKNPAPPNYTRFKNESFDRLYDRAIVEIDMDKRKKIFQDMDRIIIEEAPVIFLFYDQVAWFSQQNIQNLEGNALNLLKLETVNEKN